MNNYYEEKWQWMMNYCENKKIPPAQNWAWEEAEEAFFLAYKNNTEQTRNNESTGQ